MDDSDFDVQGCLARAKSGDEDAARSLVEFLYPTVIRIVRRNLPRRGAEEELAQDIFVKMFTRLETYRGEVPLQHWVSRIATNHCLNAIRAQRNRPEWRMGDLAEEHAVALEATTPDATHAHPAEALAAREMVERLLDCLNPKDRLLMRLLEMEGYTAEEVKAVTGWSLNAIRIRAFRARGKLNRRYEALKAQGKL